MTHIVIKDNDTFVRIDLFLDSRSPEVLGHEFTHILHYFKIEDKSFLENIRHKDTPLIGRKNVVKFILLIHKETIEKDLFPILSEIVKNSING